MALIGLHLEGAHDDEVFPILIGRLLGVEPHELHTVRYPNRAGGWRAVFATLPAALRQLWQAAANGVLVAVDNGGTPQVVGGVWRGDAAHPRHTAAHDDAPEAGCRHCQLQLAARRAAANLPPYGAQHPRDWPVVIAVPVEALESWLLWGADQVGRPRVARPEDLAESALKHKLYGRLPRRRDLLRVAIPIVERMDLEGLRRDVPSFAQFADALERNRERLLAEPQERP